ncbi:MAG: NAD(P)-dependent oxidoreductase [Reyranella sp.]|uniref:NAD-dependent epimerase/dehydratase family protein n=1 Tax=Reyranella sp. TaxID=1929291 RepID=UPI001217A06D|nr:NAD-dependent epimerase/dehydratase family protein [Reyranella sp.]TAJ92130.1 MAG: NAD(P)-dependent oxidoreductase [Reyranella sp.]
MQSKRDALIGYTGFVGDTINRSDWPFAARFNSANIETMRGERFDTVVCAGVYAEKWKANRAPDADWSSIQRLIDILDTVSANRFVLISTIDVYPTPLNVTEDDLPPRGAGEPYGRHRLELEYWIANKFPRHHILRLPALFGPGLKKNAIFDLLVGNLVDRINPNGVYQWYPVARIAADIRRVIDADVRLINIAVEALRTGDIAEQLFPGVAIGSPDLPVARYDMRTRHAALLGGRGDYHMDASNAFAELSSYVSAVRLNGGKP